MPIRNSYPVLDGVAPSWADIIVKVQPLEGAVLETEDIAALTRSRTREVGKKIGASGGRPMKRTTGSVTYEASITLYREGYDKLIRALRPLAPQRGNQRLISLVTFNVQVQHTPPTGTDIFEYRLKGCQILSDSFNHAEGTDAEQVELGLDVLEIVDIIDGEEIVML